MIFLLAIVLGFITIVVLFEKIKDKKILVKLISLFLIFFVAFHADNQWCYLTLIIILAGNSNLISTEIIQLALSFRGEIKKELITTQNEQEEKELQKETDIKNYMKEQDTINSISINSAEYKDFLQEGLIKYKSSEKKVVSWFKSKYSMDFEQNMVVKYKNNKALYPDGIISTKDIDSILEVKLIKNEIFLQDSLHRCKCIYYEYNNIYDSARKKFKFIVAIVIENLQDNNKFKEITSNYNFEIYIFNKDMDLLYKS